MSKTSGAQDFFQEPGGHDGGDQAGFLLKPICKPILATVVDVHNMILHAPYVDFLINPINPGVCA